MNKPILWRFAVTFVVIAAAFYSAWPLNEKIHLGLDLQGGMHLVYEVQSEKAVEMTLQRDLDGILSSLEKEGVTPIDLRYDDQGRLRVELAQESDLQITKTIVSDVGDFSADSSLTQGLSLVYIFDSGIAKDIKADAVDQALETLRNRIDQFGVSEPVIQRQGENRLLIQLPGIKEPERAKGIIKTTARLEFKLVDETASIQDAMVGNIPPHLELLYEYSKDPVTGNPVQGIPYLVEKRILMGGEAIDDADVRIDQRFNEPYVSLQFDKEGGKRFLELTEKYIKRRLAIVLDGKVHSAPVIQERIPGGQAQISGSFTAEEAHDLTIILRAGALPAPLELLEERTVGPSLGADSVKRGITSILYGFVAVVLFMLAYYRVGGLIADAALLINLIIIAGAMGYLEATLTLPGIAGIILTVGMAVDANVLVFERIREEVDNGKTIRAAVDAGFSKAYVTIVDANITTLIVALVLFQFGTGPIKGFAVTLTIGILASLFTALFVSRTIFSLILVNRKVSRISL